MQKIQKLNDWLCKACIRVSDWVSQPLAIVVFPILCGSWLWVGGSVNVLTLILSIAAITITQMVLRSQTQETELNKLQMDELIRAIPSARNDLIVTGKIEPEVLKRLKEITNAQERT